MPVSRWPVRSRGEYSRTPVTAPKMGAAPHGNTRPRPRFWRSHDTEKDQNEMTTSTTQLTTRLRTWALIAGLTGLLIAVGALIGGLVLWLFVAGAVAMNLTGYLYSDRLALRAARAHPLTEQQTPELFAIAADLADLAQIPIPRLYVMPGQQPNAFATGRDQRHAAVAMTTGLLEDLEPEQVRGVLAHEFAHIKNHDILVSSVAAMVAGAISAVASILQLSFLFGSHDEDSPLGSLATMILAPFGAMLIQMGVSRQREYLATRPPPTSSGPANRLLTPCKRSTPADSQP